MRIYSTDLLSTRTFETPVSVYYICVHVHRKMHAYLTVNLRSCVHTEKIDDLSSLNYI